jgi:hypothetical protein
MPASLFDVAARVALCPARDSRTLAPLVTVVVSLSIGIGIGISFRLSLRFRLSLSFRLWESVTSVVWSCGSASGAWGLLGDPDCLRVLVLVDSLPYVLDGNER